MVNPRANWRVLWAGVITGLLIASARGQGPAATPQPEKTVFKETARGKVPPGEWKMIGVDGDRRHWGVVLSRNGREVVIVDGVEGKEYEAVLIDSVQFSGDGKRVAYVARQDRKYHAILDGVVGKEYDDIVPGSLALSPDGKRLAYAARRGLQQFAVIDGVEGPAFDVIGSGPMVFSPDGKRVFYAGTRGKKVHLVADGKEEAAYDAIRYAQLSPDGKAFAYAAWTGDQVHVVVNGQQGKPIAGLRQGSMFFAPDGRLYYVQIDAGKKESLSLDGIEGPKFAGIPDRPVFSEDGKHCAYAAHQADDDWYVVHDGVSQKRYAGVMGPTISPDGKRLAYGAKPKGAENLVMVVDGADLGPFEEISAGTPVFSPDSKHLAFAAESPDGENVFVLDGVRRKMDSGISPFAFSADGKSGPSIRFSADSKRHACVATLQGAGQFIVIDGVAGKKFDSLLLMPTFSPDGKHVVYVGCQGNTVRLVVGAAQTRRYDRMAGGSRVIFDAPDKFHTMVINNGTFYWIDCEIHE